MGTDDCCLSPEKTDWQRQGRLAGEGPGPCQPRSVSPACSPASNYPALCNRRGACFPLGPKDVFLETLQTELWLD